AAFPGADIYLGLRQLAYPLARGHGTPRCRATRPIRPATTTTAAPSVRVLQVVHNAVGSVKDQICARPPSTKNSMPLT
ncbi:MAG: hypothetical protein QOJ27_3342, partial [Sphingomonadales bacterium]|nr:hypothetical protein [Sphingomonadales bacterium]